MNNQAIGESDSITKGQRHLAAVNYAVKKILESPVSEYLKNLYVFGSYASGTYQYHSDIDLFLVLDERAGALKNEIRCLHSDVTMEEPDSVETDLTIVLGEDWEKSDMIFYREIQKTGRRLL